MYLKEKWKTNNKGEIKHEVNCTLPHASSPNCLPYATHRIRWSTRGFSKRAKQRIIKLHYLQHCCGRCRHPVGYEHIQPHIVEDTHHPEGYECMRLLTLIKQDTSAEGNHHPERYGNIQPLSNGKIRDARCGTKP